MTVFKCDQPQHMHSRDWHQGPRNVMGGDAITRLHTQYDTISMTYALALPCPSWLSCVRSSTHGPHRCCCPLHRYPYHYQRYRCRCVCAYEISSFSTYCKQNVSVCGINIWKIGTFVCMNVYVRMCSFIQKFCIWTRRPRGTGCQH